MNNNNNNKLLFIFLDSDSLAVTDRICTSSRQTGRPDSRLWVEIGHYLVLFCGIRTGGIARVRELRWGFLTGIRGNRDTFEVNR